MKFPTAAILPLGLGFASAAEFTKEFEALEATGDKAAIREFLHKAAVEEGDNPDYYAKAGNYWWGLAGPVSISPVPAGQFTLDPKDMSIRDPETGEVVGKIDKPRGADPKHREKALEVLSEGTRKFPKRADIALGLAHVQQKMGKDEGLVDTLTAMLAEAEKDPAALEWSAGEALPEPAETFIPEAVQPYSATLFKTNTPSTDALCGRLLSAVTEAFPDHPYAYNLQAALADATGKPDEALRILKIAHRKAPEDSLILSNLAGAYAKSGQGEEAIASYQKLLARKLDARTRRKAELALERLRKPEPAEAKAE